jgi:ligand-binding sensor domain-containing protein
VNTIKRTILFVLLFGLGTRYGCFSQEYSYTHYDAGQGLAGSRVYCITQDKFGFIWVGTENGVCRFDGSHFSIYTTKDGLPDLEVLQIFADTRGRVWMAPFRKSVCYYLDGRIHTEQNDSLLARVHLNQNIESFAEDASGNILMQERNALHLLRRDGSIVYYDSLDHAPIACLKVSTSASGHFLAQTGRKVVEFSGEGAFGSVDIPIPPPFLDHTNNIALSPHYLVYKSAPGGYTIRSLSGNTVVQCRYDSVHNSHVSFSIIGDSLIYSNETSGSLEYNVNTGRRRRFLEGIVVSKTFEDRTGNTWFTTLGSGLYRLNSNDIQTVHLAPDAGGRSGITAISRLGNELWVGDDRDELYVLSLPGHVLEARHPFFYNMPTRICFIDSVGGNRIVTASEFGMTEGTRGWKFIRELPNSVKSAALIDSRRLLIGGSWGAGIFDLVNFRFTEILWQERCTAVFYHADTIYVGTLNGLYRSTGGQSPVFLGDKVPFLRRRISRITEAADGVLWIASYDDAGIIGYKDGRCVASLGRQQGLTSDICRTLLADGSVLWVGTDKGLNRVELDKPGYPTTPYTFQDGLGSDLINTLFVDGTTTYVGTEDGLSFFDKKRPAGSESCLLYLTSLGNSGRERIGDTSRLELPYTDKRVRFEFVALSFRSAGEITYRYRMLGLDTVWRETRENVVEYPDLPSGTYEWQLMAVNRFGNRSRLLTVPVRVDIQFWKRTWVLVSVWLLSILASWGAVSLRVRWIRRRQREKEALQQRMNELESTALKSQMNPHFIFNCLNSIQNSIFSGDVRSANRYIAGLAGLIRMTLNNSSRTFVSIGEEVEYLCSYLELEKMRFKDKIDYELTVDETLDRAVVLIPPMLIQPYVENGLHHGLHHKKEGRGTIKVRLQRWEDGLLVTVEDNGVGRPAGMGESERGAQVGERSVGEGKRVAREVGRVAREVKRGEHSPKGMSLTEDRIAILNKLYGDKTRLEIIDLKDAEGRPAGTRIEIRLPLSTNLSL